MKVIIDIETELFNNVVERTQEGEYMSDVWLAVGHGEPYKIGKWIRQPQGHYVCSLCEKGMYKSNFCPSCGADMRGDKE